MSDCIIWNKSFSTNGYGQVWVDGKLQRAHRVEWEKVNGKIPTGMVLDHLCRNRKCVNLDHLEIVTQSVNILRGLHSVDNKVTCPKGHPFIKENIMIRKNGWRECAECNRVRARAAYLRKKEMAGTK